jgi:hypothetical protein
MENLDLNDSLRKMVGGFFQSGGPVAAMATDSPLVRNPQWQPRASYAVDGLRLRPAEILTPGNGPSLPLTDPLKRLLAAVDGRRNTQEVMQTVGNGDDRDRDLLTTALKEALMYGAIVARPPGA